MTHRPTRAAVAAAVLLAGAAPACAAALSPAAIDAAAFAPLPEVPTGMVEPEVVKAEVLLDRAHFSPGSIDGIDGENFRGALRAYQLQAGLPASGRLDEATWGRLTSGAPAPLTTAEITRAEADGPFTPSIPADFEAQSRLRRMGYRDLREELAERYHMGQGLLAALNPGVHLAAGERITVADVAAPPAGKAARVVVDKAGHDVEALGPDGRLLAYYPASIGSADTPAPSGELTIRRVDRDPVYTYDPSYHFRGVSAKAPFSIAPGPNNPVGLVWMDLGGGGYGIHGTPDPDEVGKTQSHGCIRLTNWDALGLAAEVGPGTPVSFGDVPGSIGTVPPAPPAAEAALPAVGAPGQAARTAPAPAP